MPERTPSQTVGPFLHIGLQQGTMACARFYGQGRRCGVPGIHIRIEGRVLDSEGNMLPDALVEIWQADIRAATRTRPTAGRWRRTPSAAWPLRNRQEGGVRLHHHQAGTSGPQRQAQAPHINVGVLARGM